MAKVSVYNQTGEQVGDIELDAQLFEVTPDKNLVHEAVVAQQANARQVLAHAKDRSEVRGGGRKPWKQKGTGRARAGSRRSPLWRHGGVTFGPLKNRNFDKKINRKAKRKALAMTLSDKVAHAKFVVVDSLELPEVKTKTFAGIYAKLPVAGKKTLVVAVPGDVTLRRATKNLPKVNAIGAKSLNVVDILGAEYILISKDALQVVSETYTEQK
ncbi:MAG: 50S ribosomal protein L4 [Candidatus Uhrbacteria bacterium]|nr:50S ribosomal protein L4 [Patescibacteria group bacterium]